MPTPAQTAQSRSTVLFVASNPTAIGLPFTAFQWLPSGEERKAVKQWRDRDAAWTNVAKGIRQVAEGLKQPTRLTR